MKIDLTIKEANFIYELMANYPGRNSSSTAFKAGIQAKFEQAMQVVAIEQVSGSELASEISERPPVSAEDKPSPSPGLNGQAPAEQKKESETKKPGEPGKDGGKPT